MLIKVIRKPKCLIFGVKEVAIDQYEQALAAEESTALAVLDVMPTEAGFYEGIVYTRLTTIAEAPQNSVEVDVTINPYYVLGSDADGTITPIVDFATVTPIECTATVLTFYTYSITPNPLEVDAFEVIEDLQTIVLKSNYTSTSTLTCPTTTNAVLIRKYGTTTWYKPEEFSENFTGVVTGTNFAIEVKWLKATAGYSTENLLFMLELTGEGDEGIFATTKANISLLAESTSEVFRFVKFGEGYADYQYKKTGSSITVYTFQKNSEGTYYYNWETGEFTTDEIEGSPKFSRFTTTALPQGNGSAFESKFTTCNLIFSESPYIFANNKAFIHAATSLGVLAISNVKGGRYEDDDEDAKTFNMYIENNETGAWTDSTTQRYKYNKQLFIKEITSISEKEQSVKFTVVATLVNGNDEIAINSIVMRAGEIIFIGGE